MNVNKQCLEMYCLVQELRGMLAPLTRYHKLTCSSKFTVYQVSAGCLLASRNSLR